MHENNGTGENKVSFFLTLALTKTLLVGAFGGLLGLVQFLLIKQNEFNEILRQALPY